MAMTAPGGGGTTKPGRRQPRRGSLVGRLNRTERRYERLAQAFPHAPPSLLIETAGRLRRARYRRGDIIVAEGEPADRFYIMTAGEAELVQRVEDRDVYVCTFAPS
jgi:CRP-like cAMP-binding protein